METIRWCLLFLFVALLSVNAESSEEQVCHEQCANGCFGPGPEECCHEQCHDGCTDATDVGCKECKTVRLEGRCQESCGPAFLYNEVTFDLEPNPDFKFQHGQDCVEKCPKFAFAEGVRCVDRCSLGYRPEGDQCIRCGGACPEQGDANLLVQDQCDGVKQYEWGVINRKNSPTGNVTCTQVLIGPHGSTLKLKLTDVNIRKAIDEKLVLSADGYSQSFDRENYATTLTLKTDALIIQHRTVAAGSGYILSYNFVAPGGEVDNHGGCNEVLTTNTGSFESPGYPNKYRAREHCTYHIIVDPSHRIEVVFSRLYLQGDEPECLADKMEVIEPVLATHVTYCGRKKPPFTVTSKTNCLVLKFTSDDSRNYKGYRATFRAVEVPEGEKEDFSIETQEDMPPAF